MTIEENIGNFFQSSMNYDYWILRLTNICSDQSIQNLEYCAEIISYYLYKYIKVTKKVHPYINQHGLKHIVNELINPTSLLIDDMTSGDYKELINQHFKTQYTNCDYSIFHFISGTIRDNRFYEIFY